MNGVITMGKVLLERDKFKVEQAGSGLPVLHFGTTTIVLSEKYISDNIGGFLDLARLIYQIEQDIYAEGGNDEV